MNKKGFIVYFIVFFMIIIFFFGIFYFNRVTGTTKQITREGGKLAAKELCDIGLSMAKKIIYQNYYEGNYELFESGDSLDIEEEFKAGSVKVLSIAPYGEGEKGYINLDYTDTGVKNGTYDVLLITVEAKSNKYKQKVKAEYVLKVLKNRVIK